MFSYKELVDQMIEEAIMKGEIVGANVLVMQHGKELYSTSKGYGDREANHPMTRDTIFRMFSMTKPVTSVAVMILLERGMIDLFDKISDYIPEFSRMQVIQADGSIAPAKKEITIWNLLTMTSGIPYDGENNQSERGMAALFAEANKRRYSDHPMSTIEYCRRVALEVPLCFEPGTKWMYGFSADILGGLVEVISGKKYGQFLQDEIFGPLGMKDTGFFVPKEKEYRFAGNYDWNEDMKRLVPYHEFHLGLEGYYEGIGFESGGAGLVSTIDDYSRFARMMSHAGSLNGTRILGRKTVEMMTKNQLSEAQRVDYNWDSVLGYGYGCLMRVMEQPGMAGSNASKGEFGWDGWTGNYVTMDPKEDLVLLYFIQRCGAGTTRTARRLRNVTFASID